MKNISEGNKTVIFPEGRIDTNNADGFAAELKAVIEASHGAVPDIDASELEYISSAGLRVLLTVTKKYGRIKVRNVSAPVYDIFSATGFTEVLDVDAPPKADGIMDIITVPEFDLTGLELITSDELVQTYRIDDDKIIRVFNEHLSLEYIRNNKQKTEISLKAGVPVCITFDIVDCGGRYGIIYENIKGAEPLIDIMSKDKPRLADTVTKLAEWTKKMNSIDVSRTSLTSSTNALRHLLSKMEATGVLTSDETDRLRRVIVNIPESHCYSHSNLTPANILCKDGEFIVMDSFMASEGHPIVDLSSILWNFKMMPQFGRKDMRFTPDECELIWNTFLRTYLDTDDKQLLIKAEYQILQFTAVRYLTLMVMLPGTIDGSAILQTKRTALAMSDSIEPLCF